MVNNPLPTPISTPPPTPSFAGVLYCLIIAMINVYITGIMRFLVENTAKLYI